MIYPSIVSSSDSFISVLEFSEYRSFASLGRFVPNYFILFNAVVNELFLPPFSPLILVCGSAADFCVLIFSPTTLSNLLMSSSGYLVASLGFSMYSIPSTANSVNFQWNFFISFP